MFAERLCKMLLKKKTQKLAMSYKELKGLCHEVIKVIRDEPVCLKLEGNLFCFGSFYGDFDGLKYWMRKLGLPVQIQKKQNQISYLFLGNYINHGDSSLLTLLSVFALKIKFPSQIYLLAGTEEDNIDLYCRLTEECSQVFNNDISKSFQLIKKVVTFISRCALVDGKYLCANNEECLGFAESSTEKPFFKNDNQSFCSVQVEQKCSLKERAKTLKKLLKQQKLSKVILSDKIFPKGYLSLGSSRVKNLLSCFTFHNQKI